MINAKCVCGAKLKVEFQDKSDERRFVEEWQTEHERCSLRYAAIRKKEAEGSLIRPVRDDWHATRDEHRERALRRYDTDSDGSLDANERASAREGRRARRLERYDGDGDGYLNRTERGEGRRDRGSRRAKHRAN